MRRQKQQIRQGTLNSFIFVEDIVNQKPIKNLKLFKDFDNFIYRDQVTRKRYEYQHLKTEKIDANHKRNSTEELYALDQQKQKEQTDEMVYFLKQLNILNTIKENRNTILTKPSERKGSRIYQKIEKPVYEPPTELDKDVLKQRIRKQVSRLNHEYLSDYLNDRRIFKIDYANLQKASNRGALTLEKVIQMKRLIKQCSSPKKERIIKEENKENNSLKLIKSSKLKKIDRIETQIDSEWKQMQKEIKYKVFNQALHIFDLIQSKQKQKIILNQPKFNSKIL